MFEESMEILIGRILLLESFMGNQLWIFFPFLVGVFKDGGTANQSWIFFFPFLFEILRMDAFLFI